MDIVFFSSTIKVSLPVAASRLPFCKAIHGMPGIEGASGPHDALISGQAELRPRR